MATVQATSTAASAQARPSRATTSWPPPPASGLSHTRPWRSSPLAGPVFSTLPPSIPEGSEESHENDLGAREHPRTRSPSLTSQTGSLIASGYESRSASGSASALMLAEGEASKSSISLTPSAGAYATSSSHGHSSSQSHSRRPSRLSKSWRHRTSWAGDNNPASSKDVGDVSSTSPPRARTASHGNLRSASFAAPPLASSSSMPQPSSRAAPPEDNSVKQPPPKSRDPASNWMSSTPFGPAQTPKFSRLSMASPAVVMPLSARDYRKQKARDSFGKGMEKDPPTSSNRVTFIDNALSAFQGPGGVPMVKVSPPSEDAHRAPSSSGDHDPDRRSQAQSQADHPPAKPLPQTSMSSRTSSPKLKRPRSRPHTPPRSSPLAAHPPISPKSSAGTFFSATSGSDDDTVPPARPRPRRKSYPDRPSNGAGVRLSLLEAMNRLSQEGASQHPLSDHSQADGVNRLSMASQASGNTLFYEVGESEGERGQVTNGHGKAGGDVNGGGQSAHVPRTQSLDDLSSPARTGVEGVRPNGDGDPGAQSGDERKGKRNVRVVRISDTVEVSPPPMTRRRKLTKSRQGPARGPAPVNGTALMPGKGSLKDAKAQTQTQNQERRASLLPWKSKGPGENKGDVANAGSRAATAEKNVSTPTRVVVHLNDTPSPTPVPLTPSLVANGSAHEGRSKPESNPALSKKRSSEKPAAASSPDLGSPSTPRKSRRYTFSFFPSSTLHRPKREKCNTAPASVDLGPDTNTKGKLKGSVIPIERSGTDSTSTSIRTITQGSQSTLMLQSPGLSDLTPSGSMSGWGTKSPVPMLRRLNAQEMATAGVPSPSQWEGKRGSTPSLITNGSTATTLSSPRTPSYSRIGGCGEPFVPRPSGLKESFTDTSEEESDGMSGVERTSKMCVHQRHEPSPLTRAGVGWGRMSEENERHLRPDANPRLGSRPGTSSSTLTTATEASESYLSFSTVPASTASSSSSASRSESPSPGKQGRVVSVLQDGDGDEDGHACALCGHRSMTPLSSRSLSPSSTYDPALEGMHPMFTVPLVTAPASVLSAHYRSNSNTQSAVPRYANTRKEQRKPLLVPVFVADVPASVSVPPTRSNQNLSYMHVNANGAPVATSTKARTTTMPAPRPLPSLVPPPQNLKRGRPQTAPAGTSDAALRFIEEAKAMRAREGGVDIDVLIGGDHPTKPKTGSGESKIKSALKGLLRWGG